MLKTCSTMKSSSLFMIFTAQKNPHFPYDSYPPFDLGEMDDSECLSEFRVHKCDIPALANHLRIPDNFYCQQRSVSDGIEGLCMLLRRLSYPCWYGDYLPRLKYGNKHGS